MTQDTSLFDEIDESLRAENVEKFLRRHGRLIIIVCVSVILFTIAQVIWKNHREAENMQYTTMLLKADEAVNTGKADEAAAEFARAEGAGRGIAQLARLQQAETFASAGKFDKAVVMYALAANDISAGTDEALRNLAAINAVVIASNNHLPPPSVKLETGADKPFAAIAGQITALKLQQEGKNADAREMLEKLLASPGLSVAERTQIKEMVAVIKGSAK